MVETVCFSLSNMAVFTGEEERLRLWASSTRTRICSSSCRSVWLSTVMFPVCETDLCDLWTCSCCCVNRTVSPCQTLLCGWTPAAVSSVRTCRQQQEEPWDWQRSPGPEPTRSHCPPVRLSVCPPVSLFGHMHVPNTSTAFLALFLLLFCFCYLLFLFSLLESRFNSVNVCRFSVLSFFVLHL